MPVTINGSAGVTTNTGAVYDSLQTGTAVTASGTSVDFTSIPSWVKRVTVLGRGVSTNGTSGMLFRCGSGSFVAVGYQDTTSQFSVSAVSSSASTNTTGTTLTQSNAAVAIYNFKVTIELINASNYVITALCGRSDAVSNNLSVGSVALSGALDRVRITTNNGTDTFDAGTINIIYE